MPTWDEYVAGAERAANKINLAIDQMGVGYRTVKLQAERQVKAGLMAWLTAAPKNPRSKANVFLHLSNTADVRGAYAAVDEGMKYIEGLRSELPLGFVPAGVKAMGLRNIYAANAYIAQRVEGILEDLELPTLDSGESEVMLRGIIEDNRLNIIGIETRDGRQLKEKLQRAVTGEQAVATVRRTIAGWTINKAYYDLSTLAHPRATARAFFAKSGEKAVASGAAGWSDFDIMPWMILPAAIGHSKRVDDDLSYRMKTTKELDDISVRTAKERGYPADWRGLGYGYNTNEMYFPVFKTWMDEAEEWAAGKRAEVDEYYEDEGEEEFREGPMSGMRLAHHTQGEEERVHVLCMRDVRA